MFTNPSQRTQLRIFLVAITLATLPCYCAGIIVIRFNNRSTPTLTVTLTQINSHTPDVYIVSPYATLTLYPTLTSLPPTFTYTPSLIPSNTPSKVPVNTPSDIPTATFTWTFSPTFTATATIPPTETATLQPTETITLTSSPLPSNTPLPTESATLEPSATTALTATETPIP
jgi:type VI secretion system secreted protein VgrG